MRKFKANKTRPARKPDVRQNAASALAVRCAPAALCLMLLALVAVAFVPVLKNGFVNYDDPMYVTRNPHVDHGLSWEGFRWAFETTEGANWHPITFLSHMLDCQWFGLAPWGHHLTSLLLHAANTVLVFLVFRAMTGAMWRSFFVAAFFGVHPLHVESVAWVAERKDVLSAFFWLLTMLAYVRYVKFADAGGAAAHVGKQSNSKSPVTASRRRARIWYVAALVLFALGLMSKPMVVTLPFVLLLLDYWPLRRTGDSTTSARWRRLALEKAPFFALAAACCVITVLIQKNAGAMERLAGLTFGNRFGNALVAYGRYLDKLFWPADFSVFYPHPGHWPAGTVIAAAAVLAAITLGAVVLRKRAPYVGVGWFWFLGTLVPVIGIVQVGGQSIADRYMYLPLIGALVVVVWGVHELTAGRHFQRTGLAVAGTGAALVCAALARGQVACWRDSGTLFRQAIAATGRNYIACFHLADYLLAEGQTQAAIDSYRECIAIFPGMKEAHNNLAAALLIQGRVDEAIEQFNQAINLKPAFPDPHNGLGVALQKKGRLDDALAEFQRAADLDPEFFQAHLNLADALTAKGRLDEAVGHYGKALKLRPESAEAHGHLGRTLAKLGQRDEAASELKEALALQPDDAEARRQLQELEGGK
jgi:tetratricopeptide (TPR) repeat protein